LPLHVIPNGVDIDYFAPAADSSGDSSDRPTLLFVGNFEYGPNVDAALWLVQDIFPLIQRSIPNARLSLVGNNPPPTMRALASSVLDVTGRVPDVRPYLNAAMLFVSPLRVGAGIKNKVLEAMAMGKPLVATLLSADGIDLEAGTHVLYGSTAEQIADATVQLIRDPDLRRRMASANRQFVAARFTWQRVADDYEALYRRMIDSKDEVGDSRQSAVP
jgi:glycosyltransferase involved in cell wall biosynthesis